NDSLTWSEELARYIFIWESWLGISLGQKKGQHIAVNMLTNRLKGNVRKYTLVLADICTVVFIAILVAKGLEVTNKIMLMGSLSAALHIPMFWIYLSMPVGCGLMGLRLLEDIYKKIRSDVEEVV
ncbi:MAG: TRAP transporter small permease, partial [Eubacteriales bacterium]|nr:TRAP transporter small permease [Eubacteriales bacterium]